MKGYEKMKNYYLGFDMGTDSSGWAVTNDEYKLQKFKGKSMWGVRLFNESETAENQRFFRCGTRRLNRRKKRIEWLQMLFDEEISKVDRGFFNRLKESNLYLEDKSSGDYNCVFADENYNDIDFHKEYKTIYHLRKELIESDEPHDIRLVYLAVHHIIKHRGHFLFDNLGDNINSNNSFEVLFEDFKNYLWEEYSFELECVDENEFSETIKNKMLNITKKSEKIKQLCGISKKGNPQIASILHLMCGGTSKLSDIFEDTMYDDGDLKKISFSNGFDDKESEYQDLLNERYELIEKIKAIYDWAILDSIVNGEKYISFAKVKSYDEHKADLDLLKEFVRHYCKEKYNKIFRETKKNLNNYTAYSGKYKDNGHNGVILQRINQEDFCKFLSAELKDYKAVDSKYDLMFQKIENSVFMPKQITKNNGVIPMQLNRQELKIILDNASKCFEFLNAVDSTGFSVKDKIIKIFEYRIPYYVGPLNSNSERAWIVRDEEEKIYPWNFDKVVDIEKSAENFINKLTSKCTYLRDKDVIPKRSVLYSKYLVLNELNNLRMNGEKLDVKLKQDIFNNLFLKRKKVTVKAVKEYIKAVSTEDVELTGIDRDFKSNMSSYIELFEFNLSTEDMEKTIKAITIFGDDKNLLRKRLKNQLGDKLNNNEIKKISNLKYKDWGAFSKEFLTDIYDVSIDTGEAKDNIINTLWNTQDNLMELLGSKYNFSAAIENEIKNIHKADTIKEMVNELYISPKVKRPVYQTLKIANEITKVMGNKPKKIFIEMTRSNGTKGEAGRKESRKDRLIKLYKACKKDSGELFDSLKDTPEDKFRRDKLYFYYTQFGKCMYSGEKINLDNLFNENIYDIDHIFPRSKIKDDSLDNRVLVKKQINAHKDNDYPINADIQKKMKEHWFFLFKNELISRKKYERLTRITPLTDDELSDFIGRQLVETGQSAKAVAELFKVLYPETEIVYVKASTVSYFRDKYDMIKCRPINDLHHAKDAYLNIVVGNVYNVKYTHNKRNFIKGLQTKKYSLNKMFEYSTAGAWKTENSQSISVVKNTMRKNNIIVTRYQYEKTGKLFDATIEKKVSHGKVPLKKNSPLCDISKYGGYSGVAATYFAIVEIDNKKKDKRLVPISLYNKKDYLDNPLQYLTNVINKKISRILVKCVKIDSLFEINKFRIYLSGNSDSNRFAYKPAIQLILDYDTEKYIKSISSYVDKVKKKEISSDIIPYGEEFTKDNNLLLYNQLISKMTATIFKEIFEYLGKALESKILEFKKLSYYEQCYVLVEVIKHIHCNAVKGDLKYLNITCKPFKMNKILKGDSMSIINQSVTGLFDNKIDLLNI